MKFGVVIFPGSNCDKDLIHVVKNTMKKEVVELWHKDHNLQGCDFILLPGGFSYGDYLRSGAIARFSSLMQEIIEFADKGGFVFWDLQWISNFNRVAFIAGCFVEQRQSSIRLQECKYPLRDR